LGVSYDCFHFRVTNGSTNSRFVLLEPNFESSTQHRRYVCDESHISALCRVRHGVCHSLGRELIGMEASITFVRCCATLRRQELENESMALVSRIGVSLDSELLDRFDKFIAEKGYDNRSEAFRDLIRDRLVGSAVVTSKACVVGTVTLIYDHHTRLLPEKLADLQHEHHEVVISTLHAHLDHDTCLEVVLLRGKSRLVQQLADKLISTKGVRHGRLVMSSPDTVSPSRHFHP